MLFFWNNIPENSLYYRVMKIAFFDIDGTLIDVPNGLNKPTQQTIDTLHKFQKEGNLIFVATARGKVPQVIRDIGFDGYICNDGHYIVYHEEVILDELFSKQQVHQLRSTYLKTNGKAIFDGHQGSWCDCANHPLQIKHRQMFHGTSDKPEHLVENFIDEQVQAISSCVLFSNVEDMWNCYRLLEDDFTMIPYETGLIRMDVYNKGYTKGTACEAMCQNLSVDYKDTYAFGDGVNDIEMLQLVNNGIAMGNASNEVKEKASFITDSVLNDGITKYFNEFIHKKNKS